MFKEIHYAYPTSPIATKLHYANVGCWYLKIGGEIKCASSDKNIVLEEANTYPVRWGFYSMHNL